ncbi:hypothetical protein BBJ28_00009337 [Nothophytophthora sp. Chile5]|nr:hypothetical protein BBJ28_00009337 [Nothophytophthora sp. Chile5]
MADSAYSFSLTTFNPSGKLLQIEYALNAVNSGGKTSLGIKCTSGKNGVVIATEKKLPTILVDEESHKKIAILSEPAGVVYSGLGPDYRVLVRKARKKAQTYFQKYKEFTQSGGVRPFGVSILYAGYDDDGPQLYQIDPSGAYFGWKATAIGKDSVSAKTFLERMDETNIEVGIIKEDKKFHVLTPAEVKDYLEQAE